MCYELGPNQKFAVSMKIVEVTTRLIERELDVIPKKIMILMSEPAIALLVAR